MGRVFGTPDAQVVADRSAAVRVSLNRSISGRKPDRYWTPIRINREAGNAKLSRKAPCEGPQR